MRSSVVALPQAEVSIVEVSKMATNANEMNFRFISPYELAIDAFASLLTSATGVEGGACNAT